MLLISFISKLNHLARMNHTLVLAIVNWNNLDDEIWDFELILLITLK